MMVAPIAEKNVSLQATTRQAMSRRYVQIGGGVELASRWTRRERSAERSEDVCNSQVDILYTKWPQQPFQASM